MTIELTPERENIRNQARLRVLACRALSGTVENPEHVFPDFVPSNTADQETSR